MEHVLVHEEEQWISARRNCTFVGIQFSPDDRAHVLCAVEDPREDNISYRLHTVYSLVRIPSSETVSCTYLGSYLRAGDPLLSHVFMMDKKKTIAL